ncbi:tetratricopeptide repeat protein [Chitinophaga skermanii]|uniref:Tetratricopeptide repeat protein n=1 Tax=Chitinophaga skermanii TaxID=331697 RepID=A0A327QAW2_9BACT|nr:SH3 domain-containing protein [Chitinophaga skermanii]RAJ01570.1 tetratricopeptide repeat protein [Chitinophaga skermanii]
MRQVIRKWGLICVLALSSLAQLKAQAPVQQQFDAANVLFREQKYAEAANAYQHLIDSGYQADNLYYNAGNAYLKLNKTGPAVYSFEKALKLNPNNQAAANNLQIASLRIKDNVDPLPLLFFQEWFITLEKIHSPNGWAIGCIVVFWILAIAFMLYRFVPRFHHKFIRWGMYGITVFFLGYLTMSIYVYSVATDDSTAIVMQTSSKVKEAPDAKSRDMFEAREGMKVEILDTAAGFSKIQLADGKTGWIPVQSIKVL